MQEDLATSVIDLLEKRKIRINMISKEEKDKIITSIGTEEGKPPPSGNYGVFCEPLGHIGNPKYFSSKPITYEEAVIVADLMCRANNQWHYYPKPIR